MKAALSYPISFCSVIVHRTQSTQTADAIHADGERNPIRRRTQSNQTANGIQSDGERNPIRRRTPSAPQTPTNTPDTQHSGIAIPPLNRYQDTMKGLYAHLSLWHGI